MKEPESDPSAVESKKNEGDIEKSLERHISELDFSAELITGVLRRSIKRKSDEKTTENLDDPEEPNKNEDSERVCEDGYSGNKRRKSETDHVIQNPVDSESKQAQDVKPIDKTTLTIVGTKDDHSIQKYAMDEPSTSQKAMNVKTRREEPNQSLGSKISSTIDRVFGINFSGSKQPCATRKYTMDEPSPSQKAIRREEVSDQTHSLKFSTVQTKSYQKMTMDEPETSQKAKKVKIRRTEVPDETLGLEIPSTTESETLHQVIPTLECTKDDSLVCAIKKSSMSEPSTSQETMKEKARSKEVFFQTLRSKILSTLDNRFRRSSTSDPEQPSTSGENVTLSRMQAGSERLRPYLAEAKKKIRELNVYHFLKLSEKEDQIFDERQLDMTLTVLSKVIKKNVMSFFREHLTNTQEPRSLLTNARKLENTIRDINNILWEIPKLHLKDVTPGGVKNLSDILTYLNGGYLTNIGKDFNFNKINRIEFTKQYSIYFRRWVLIEKEFEKAGDNVHKTFEALKLTVKDAIFTCENGLKFINKLKSSESLMKIAVMQRAHQIGEDITRPSHVSYFVPDHHLEKVKESYLNHVPCTDALHDIHTQRNEYSDTSLNKMKDGARSFDADLRICRELQKNSSGIINSIDQEVPRPELNPNTSNFLPEQLLMASIAVPPNSTDLNSQQISTTTTSSKQVSTDTSQSQYQLVPSISSSGTESSTDKNESSIDTNCQLLEGSITQQRPTNTGFEQNQPLRCTEVQQCSTYKSSQITTLGEKTKMSGDPETSTMLTLLEREANVSDPKDKNKSEAKISSDTFTYESIDSSFPDTEGEQKTAPNTPVKSPIKESRDAFFDPQSTPDQSTSTPKKRDGGMHTDDMDNKEFLKDDSSGSESIDDYLSENESSENYFGSSSSSSSHVICDKSMELDELNDHYYVIAQEIVESVKRLKTQLDDAQSAVLMLVKIKEKLITNLHQFMKMDIPGLVKT